MKTARKQFLASVVSLMLCAAMLVGTTFAWFTDSVSSTNNIIKSGNLDVDMQYLAANGEWTAVEDDTALINNDAKWEPGHAEVVYLKASNLGELALKYQLGVNILYEKDGINVYGQTLKLSNYIYMGLADLEADADGKITPFANRAAAIEAVSAEATLIAANSGKGGELYPVGNTDNYATEAYFALVIYMPETVGNEANYKTNDATSDNAPEIKLGVNIAALQLAYEGDDFTDENNKDTYYDNDINPAVTYVTTARELYDALSNGGTVILDGDIDLSEVNFTRSASFDWKPIANFSGELNGNGHKITGISGPVGLFDSIVGGTVKNLTIEAEVANATGPVAILANKVSGNVVIEDVKVSASINDENAAEASVVLVGVIEGATEDISSVVISGCEATVKGEDGAEDSVVENLVGSVEGNVNFSDGDSLPAAKVTKVEVVDALMNTHDFAAGLGIAEGTYSLDAAYKYEIPESLDDNFADWYCDFHISSSTSVKEGLVLAGNYGEFGWIALEVPVNEEGEKYEDFRLLQDTLGSTNPWTYEDVYNFVGVFTCGVVDLDGNNAGLTVTVELVLTNPETGAEHVVNVVNATLG